jgi:hypothetical protein
MHIEYFDAKSLLEKTFIEFHQSTHEDSFKYD